MNEVRIYSKMCKFNLNDIIIRYIYETENICFCVYVLVAAWLCTIKNP